MGYSRSAVWGLHMNNQLNILDAIDRARQLAPIEVHARKGDPETSHTAAAELAKDQTKLQRSVATVVAILQASEPVRLTDFQIRDKWAGWWHSAKFSDSLPCKARHWARQAGLVRHDGYGKHNGRKVRLWALGADVAFLADERMRCPHCNGTGRLGAPVGHGG
jgi:hypothetical protein